MLWLSNQRLATKLFTAFGLCTLITVSIGLLGKQGIDHQYAMLQDISSDSLVAVTEASKVMAHVIAHNRDLFKIVALTAARANPADIEATRQAMKDNQTEADSAFALYRLTPLEDDEKAAGDAFIGHWQHYTAAATQAMEVLGRNDLANADSILKNEVAPAYKATMADLTIVIDSNGRQAREASVAAQAANSGANWTLAIGVCLAVLLGAALSLFITRMITHPLNSAVRSAKRVAEGDLTHPIEPRGQDEVGQLLKALDAMQASLTSTVREIASASGQLASATEEMSAVTQESAGSLTQQNDEIQQAATAVNEMTAAVEEVARNAVSTSEVSQQTSRDASTGLSQVQQAIAAITTMTGEIVGSTGKVETLAGQIRDISQVLDVIRGIADQTNLLALNAAIEAARAGEQGRGFAVVADEVRALAHRTQASTKEIESMIGRVSSGADEAVMAMEKSQALVTDTQALAHEAGQALGRIAEGVGQINERNLVIASASEEQAKVAREVDRNLVNIQGLSSQTASGARQTNTASHELSKLAVSLNALVARFRYR